MDDEAPIGAKRSPFIERLVNNSDNNNKRGRLCGMGEQPRSANPSPASFCQLEFSSFLREEASPCDYKSETQDHLDSSLLDLGALERDMQLQQSAQESRNFQHCIQLFETYNAINEDVRRAPKCFDCANVGGLEGNVTLTSGWSVSYNAQQGEQGGDSFSAQLQNSGNDPMNTDHSYDGSSGDRDGSGDKNGSKEAMENEIATMDLTDDLLHLVFSFLDQKSLCCSAMVCRQWRMASAHEDFWKSLSFEGKNVTKKKVGWLCRKYLKAVEFTLREVPCIDKLAREAMFSLQALRNLNLHGGILTDSFFTALANGCFGLQHLSITNATLGMGGSQEVQVHHESLRQLDVIKCRVMRIAIRLAC